MSLPHRIFRSATRPLGDGRWDLFVRSTAVVALLAIPVSIALPRLVPLVWLLVMSLPANSPLSPVLPTMYEPMIMEAAKYERAIWVTLVAAVGYMYMEYLNWYAYSWILQRQSVAAFRQHAWVRRSVAYFSRAPFWTVAVFAFTPIPFWAVRILAILNHYSLGRFMTATVIGRVPRWFLYAWFGAALRVPTWLLVTVIVGGSVVAVGLRWLKHQPLLPDPALAAPAPDAARGTPAAPSGPSTDGGPATEIAQAEATLALRSGGD